MMVIVLPGKAVALPDGGVLGPGETVDLPADAAINLVTFGVVRAADVPPQVSPPAEQPVAAAVKKED